MQLKSTENILKKSLMVPVLTIALLSLTSCTTMSEAANAVLWLPKKIFSLPKKAYTGTKEKFFTKVDNSWQDDLELSQRRRPQNNPQGPMGMGTAMSNRSMSNQRGGAYPYPPSYGQMSGSGSMQQTMGMTPPQMGTMQGSMSPQNMYPPQMGMGQSPYDSGSYQSGNMMPPIGQYGTSPGQSYMQAPSPYGQMPGSAGGYGSFGQPSPYDDSPYGGSFPGASPGFIPQNHFVRKFEPMAMEGVIDGLEIKYQRPDENAPIDLANQMQNKPYQRSKQQNSRSSSMFPLEEYAPKSDVVIQQKINSDINTLIKELDGKNVKNSPSKKNEPVAKSKSTKQESRVPSPERIKQIIKANEFPAPKRKNMAKKQQQAVKTQPQPPIPQITPIQSTPIIAKKGTPPSPPRVDLRSTRNKKAKGYYIRNDSIYKGVLPKSRYSGNR